LDVTSVEATMNLDQKSTHGFSFIYNWQILPEKKKKKKEAKLKDSSIVLDVKLTPFILTSTQKKILM